MSSTPQTLAAGLDHHRAGRFHEAEVIYRSGHWRNPIPEENLKAKFRDLAGRVITAEAVAEIERVIDNLENEDKPAVRLGAAVQKVR